MLKILVMVMVFTLCVAGMSGQTNKTAGNRDRPDVKQGTPSSVVFQNNYYEPAVPSSKPTPDSPRWYAPLEKSEWWLVLLGFMTLGFVGWQAFETRKAAEATKDSVNAAYGSMQFAQAQWDLARNKERARIEIKTVDGLKVEHVGEEIWNLQSSIRIRNLGSSRAYIKRGAAHLFVGTTADSEHPEIDTWNSISLDEGFIDPHSPSNPPTINTQYFFDLENTPLSVYAHGVYEGRLPVNLYGVIEYETLGITYSKSFSYTWLGSKNPDNLASVFSLQQEAQDDEEQISSGFWREDEEGNEEQVV